MTIIHDDDPRAIEVQWLNWAREMLEDIADAEDKLKPLGKLYPAMGSPMREPARRAMHELKTMCRDIVEAAHVFT